MDAQSQPRLKRISARVIRKDGRIDDLGVLAGGHWWERAITRARIWWFNFKTRRGS